MLIANVFLFVVITSLMYIAWPLKVPDIVVFAIIVWLWSPVKQPCDYNSYSSWLKDWKNWLKKKEM